MATLSVRKTARCLGITAPLSFKEGLFQEQDGAGSLKDRLTSMLSLSGGYSGDAERNQRWRNYIQSVDIHVDTYWKPASLRELVDILHRAEDAGKRVHAVGAGFSFEDLAATQDWMVDLGNLGRVLPDLVSRRRVSRALTEEWRTRHLGSSIDKLVHVEAGARLFDICQFLDDEGLALPTMGGALGQHIAGAFSTSTHGSDIEQPPLCDLIQAVHLVTTGGREVWIESASHPLTDNDDALRQAVEGCATLEIIRDDNLLNAVVVAMGRFGVIYSVVLRVRNAFHLGEYSQEFTWTDVAAALREGVGRDNPFDPLNALLQAPPSSLQIAGTPREYRYLDVIFNTRNNTSCWVRRRWITRDDASTDLNVTPSSDFLCHPGAANGLLLAAGTGLHVYAGAVGLLPFPPIAPQVKSIEIHARAAELEAMALNPHITGGTALAAALNAIWSSQFLDFTGELPALIDKITSMTFKGEIYPGDSETQGRRGQNWVISAGSEDPKNIGDCYRGNSIEVIFGLDTQTYIDFIDAVLERVTNYRQAGYIAVRFSRRSPALLSMHNVNHDVACSIEITSLKGLADNQVWMQWVEQTAIRMGGRPHWGQQNNLDQTQIASLYPRERLQRWRTELRRIVGDSETFSNNYSMQRGLEP